jgi:two-component system chemotaxis response regulator CheB
MPRRLLIVDDSPLFRLRLSQILSASDRLQLVGLAEDGREAIRLIGERRPEVVVLDLEMPRLDGFGVLRWTRAHAPVPIVVCSGRSERESVFEALEAGAVDFLTKPELRFAVRSEAFAEELRTRVEAAAGAHAKAAAAAAPPNGHDAAAVVAAFAFARGDARRARFAAIVGSAGAPAAVARLLSELRPDFRAPLLVALHMPRGFTRSFAERLARLTRFDVREAQDGELVGEDLDDAHEFGASDDRACVGPRVRVAPGGYHTSIARDGEGRLRFRVEAARPAEFCAPSADHLLRSAAEHFGAGALGVVLTGMGEDGWRGAEAVRARGGTVLVESRDSALIWGMPRAVAEAGLASAELSLSSIAAALPLLCDRREQ